MPVLLTRSPAVDAIMMIRPQPRSFIPATTARVHRNAVVRLASEDRAPVLVGDLLQGPPDLARHAPGRS